MREILFRGKRTDTGEWLEGYLAKARWYIDARENVVIMPLDLALYPHSEFSECYEVIPETVGQFTGLEDRNGKKIFEGDIVAKDGNSQYIFEVSYCEEYAGFYPFFDKDNECGYGVCAEQCTVTGNIHDNPELLKSEDTE